MKIIVVAIVTIGLVACSANPQIQTADTTPNPYTHGNVQLTLKKGVTGQSDVLNTFGPPNVATIDSSGNEVWTYQKNATVAKATESNVYGTIIVLGGSQSTSGFEQSSKLFKENWIKTTTNMIPDRSLRKFQLP